LSARISLIDRGVDASNRFMVNRTARLCTSGMNNRPRKTATKNTIPPDSRRVPGQHDPFIVIENLTFNFERD
jgi:hypothetical protein